MRLRGQPTEDTMRTVGARLRKGRKLRGMTQTDLATRIGTSPNQISMIENGQSGTSIRTMVAAANALNVSLDFLAGLTEDVRPSRKLLFDLRDVQTELWDLKHGDTGRVPAHYDGTTHIEVIDVRTAAGAGAVVHGGEGVKSMIAFPVAWLRERGLQPKNCRVIEVVGESMEPTLADGCSILIDLSSSDPYPKGLFVMRTEDELIVKRLMHDQEAGWLLVSDNPDKKTYPTRPWRSDTRILAEVKWQGGGFWETGHGPAPGLQ